MRAVGRLGEIGGGGVVGLLIQALQDRDWLVRTRAACALGKMKDARAVVPLVQALKDDRSIVRRNVAH